VTYSVDTEARLQATEGVEFYRPSDSELIDKVSPKAGQAALRWAASGLPWTEKRILSLI
jgi:hypothetical protein